jgi:hypothetical protein
VNGSKTSSVRRCEVWDSPADRCTSTRGAEEKKRKKRRTYLPTCYLFLRFFEIFRSDLRKHFYGVFGLRMQSNGQKRDKKKSMGKDERKKVFFSQLFRPKVFDMYFPLKSFHGVGPVPEG